MKKRLAAVAPCLLLAGCLTSTQATRLQTDLNAVKQQIFQVQQDSAASKARLEELVGRLGASGQGSGQADLQATLQTLMDQMQALSEQLREVKAKMNGLTQEKPAGREKAGRVSPAVATSQPPAGPSTGSLQAASGPAEEAFNTAYADYSKGNYELAMMGFSDFIRTHPSHALAADAQYWIGECQFSQGKFADAVEAFDRTVTGYPDCDKAPAALLKKAIAQMESGQTSQAATTLQALLDSQPHSEEARLAAERLKQLGLRSSP